MSQPSIEDEISTYILNFTINRMLGLRKKVWELATPDEDETLDTVIDIIDTEIRLLKGEL